MSTEFLFGILKNVLETDSGRGCSMLWRHLMPLNCVLTMVMAVNFMLCMFHHSCLGGWGKDPQNLYWRSSSHMVNKERHHSTNKKTLLPNALHPSFVEKKWGSIACLQTLSCLWGIQWKLWVQTDCGHLAWVSTADRAVWMKVSIRCCFPTLDCCDRQTEKT